MSNETLIKDAESALQKAKMAYLKLKHERDEEAYDAKRKAEAKVHKEFKEDLSKLSDAFYQAKKVYRDLKDSHVSHPWEGKIVTAKRRLIRYHQEEDVRGIVEVVRSNTEFAQNIGRYSQPSVGTVIIRAIKKDGTPSLKFHDKYYFGRDLGDWELVEE